MNKISKKQQEEEKIDIVDNGVFIWDRQPGESAKAFKLFNKYLAIGRTRNYIKVSRACEINYQTICKYAEMYSWKERADENDFHIDNEFMVKLDEEILQSRIRIQRIGSEMQKLGEKGIDMLNGCVDELSPGDVAKLIDIGCKVERLALGSATEIKESKINGKVEIEVEAIPADLAAEIGKKLAIKKSEETIINI